MKAKKEEWAICSITVIDNTDGKLFSKRVDVTVKVMARADGYAMVRRKGCAPFAVKEKYLRACTESDDAAERR